MRLLRSLQKPCRVRSWLEELEHEDRRANDHSAAWGFSCISHHLLYEGLNPFHRITVQDVSDRMNLTEGCLTQRTRRFYELCSISKSLVVDLLPSAMMVWFGEFNPRMSQSNFFFCWLVTAGNIPLPDTGRPVLKLDEQCRNAQTHRRHYESDSECRLWIYGQNIFQPKLKPICHVSHSLARSCGRWRGLKKAVIPSSQSRSGMTGKVGTQMAPTCYREEKWMKKGLKQKDRCVCKWRTEHLEESWVTTKTYFWNTLVNDT